MAAFDFIAQDFGTAFLFPGQGSQKVGMGRDVVDAYPAARETFEEADDLLGFGLSKLCFAGPEEELTDTINAQPALYVTSMALLRVLAQQVGEVMVSGSAPVYTAGHSMGEYTALAASGAVSFADGLRLVRERGRLMKQAGEANPGMMAAILGLDEEQVASVCAESAQKTGGVVQVANDNCPGQIVISGDRTGMEAAMTALGAVGARKVVPLAVSIAAHSPLMEPAVDEMRAAIESVAFAAPLPPIIANTRALPLHSVDDLRAELVAQLTGGVRWTESMQRALADGVTDFVEIGPGDALVGMMKRIDRSAKRHSVGSVEGIAAFTEWWRRRAE